MSLILILVLPFLGSLFAALLPSNARNAESWLAGIISLVCTFLIINLYPEISSGEIIRIDIPWIPVLGLKLIFRMDGYAWLFSLIISIMGTLVVLYARYYMSPKDPVQRFFSFFQAFMSAMLGVVLSGNIIQLILFWEITSLMSFMLIAYWHHRQDARKGARMALMITGFGGLCLFAGFLILGNIVGSYDIDDILASGNLIRNNPLYQLTLILISIGALSKSAQFPFQFWLPNAMAAPTPVSAYLHSATMVKSGVFLLARFWPVLSGTDEWFWIIGGSGLISLILGAYTAIFQQDMKGILAYSTISHLGLITLLIGLNSSLGLVAAIFHMINHATFKASLFMATGIVDHETGTRNIRNLSGLYRSMPITATLATVAAASMAGVPLLNGFISKEMFFAETTFVRADIYTRVGLPLLATIAGSFSVAYSLRFILKVFFGPFSREILRKPHEPPRWMLLPSALLVLTCLVVGIMPGITLGPFLRTASNSILINDMPEYSLSVWHGLKLPILMSSVALVSGLCFYLILRSKNKLILIAPPFMMNLEGGQIFDYVLKKFVLISSFLLGKLSSDRLQTQLIIIVISTIFVSYFAPNNIGMKFSECKEWPDLMFSILWIVGIFCALGATYQAKYHRLSSLALTGGAGLITCLTFIWFSAPDLALTQLIVEVVTAVLILLGLRWLPRRIERNEEIEYTKSRIYIRRIRDFLLAGSVGLGLALISYSMLMRSIRPKIASYFIEKSLLEAGGANVVNVILVDFRGFDTLGEITVLGIVSLTVYALLRRFRPAIESTEKPIQQRDQDEENNIFQSNFHEFSPKNSMLTSSILGRLLFPIAALVSVYFLLRGHNLPGGGFVGGLIMATAVILQYMVNGVHWVESHSKFNPQYWIGFGLICSSIVSLSASLAMLPFLSAITLNINLPLFGSITFSSVLLFDLGVYMLVMGSTVLILVALAHQSLRAQRKATIE
ncbi:MAG: monovalent cation/H+ antiporter subunit A [Bordetella sp.]|nr:MAG: monovalent cation/H+ antiporter subunit A [Bordetella sp.]